MKKKLFNELFILIIPIIIGILIFIIGFDLKSLYHNSSIDLNIHDTYFVISSFSIFLIILIVISLIFYSFRVIISRFKNFIPNMILLIIIGLMIFTMTKIISFSKSLIDLTSNYSNELIKADYNMILRIMSYLQAGLIVYFAVVGFIIRTKKNTVNNNSYNLCLNLN